MSVEKSILIPISIQLQSASEVSEYVDAAILERIKAQDPSPMFAVMSTAHEGESTGRLYKDLSTGEKVKEWFKQLWPVKAIKELVALMNTNKFTPIYEMHATGAEAKMRVAVGNVVGSKKKLINGVVHALAVAYINNNNTRDRIKAGELNACSIEATCLFEKVDTALKYVVREVRELVGIALCNNTEQATGFKNSEILAVISAMAEEDKLVHNESEKGNSMKLADIVEFVKQNGITPDKVFTVEELTSVPKVIDAFNNDFEEKMHAKDAKIKELETELKPLKGLQAKSKLAALIKGSEYLKDEYPSIVEYLVKTINIDITDVEAPQKVVDEAVKTQLALCKEAGFKLKSDTPTDVSGNKSSNKEAKNKTNNENEEKDKNKDSSERDDMLDPEYNELIPT